MGDLTVNFSVEEFDCPCCGKNLIDWSFVHKLQKARDIAKTAFVINSGWRCEKHNREVGGAENSSHLRGHAADIQASTSVKRYVLVVALLEAGFERIGVAKTFVHVDSDPAKSQGVMWLY